ncbi:MAG: EamA family transporter [Deltaproteobacteria bacterium]
MSAPPEANAQAGANAEGPEEIHAVRGERAGDVRTLAALAVGALAIGGAAPFFRAAQPIDPCLASAVRLALASLLLAPSIPGARTRGKLSPRTLQWAGLAGVRYAVHFGAWVASLGMTSVAASVTLVTATPLLLALLGWLAGRDAPGARLWLGLGLAGGGTLLIGGADARDVRGDALLGDALALLGAVAMAGILLVVRREHARLEAAAFSSIATFSGALCLAAALALRGALTGVWPPAPSAASLAWVAATAVVSQLVGHTALTWALSRASPTTVALATTTEPVIATLVVFVWMDERPGPHVLAGSAVILAGVTLGLSGRRP